MGTELLKASLLSEVGNMKRQSSSASDTPDQHPCCPNPSQGCSCISEPLSPIQGLYRLKIGAPHPPWLLLGSTTSPGFIQCSALALTGEKKQPGHNAAAQIPPAGLLIREDYEVYCCFSIILNKAAFQNCFRHIRSCTFYTSRDTGYNIFLTTLGRIYFLLPLS